MLSGHKRVVLRNLMARPAAVSQITNTVEVRAQTTSRLSTV